MQKRHDAGRAAMGGNGGVGRREVLEGVGGRPGGGGDSHRRRPGAGRRAARSASTARGGVATAGSERVVPCALREGRVGSARVMERVVGGVRRRGRAAARRGVPPALRLAVVNDRAPARQRRRALRAVPRRPAHRPRQRAREASSTGSTRATTSPWPREPTCSWRASSRSGPLAPLAQFHVRPAFLLAAEGEDAKRLETGIAPWEARPWRATPSSRRSTSGDSRRR